MGRVVYRPPLPRPLPPLFPPSRFHAERAHHRVLGVETPIGTLSAVPIARDQLDQEEDVLVDLRPHWAFLSAPVALSLAAIAAAIVIQSQFPNSSQVVWVVLAVMVGLPVLWLIVRVAKWLSTSLVVTDRRLIFRSGVLGRRVVQLRLQRIVDVHSNQSLLERIIGTGRLIVEVEGEEGAVTVEDVRRPRALQRVLTRQLDEIDRSRSSYRNQDPPPAPPAYREPAPLAPAEEYTPPRGTLRTPRPQSEQRSGPRSVSEQLIELDELRRRGILTELEFAAKKSELLDRL
jgi:membrane protein YdbS with pleckstrin-like domain